MGWQVATCLLLIASVHASCDNCTGGDDGGALLQTKAKIERPGNEKAQNKEALIRKIIQDMALDLGIDTQGQAPCPHSAHKGSSKSFAVAYEIRNSSVEGVGVFLREPVKKGQLIWTFVLEETAILFPEDAPLIRHLLKNADPQVVRAFLSDWYYQFPEYCGNCSLIGLNDDRYINDGGSNRSNLVDQGMFSLVAKSDLEAGTELLEDYTADGIDGCPVWWDDLSESIGFGDVALLRKQTRVRKVARLSTTPNWVEYQPKPVDALQQHAFLPEMLLWFAMCAWVACEYINETLEEHVMGFRNLKMIAALFVTQCLLVLSGRIVFSEFKVPLCLIVYFSGRKCVECIDDRFFRKVPIWRVEWILYALHAGVVALTLVLVPRIPNTATPMLASAAPNTVNSIVGSALALSFLGVYILNYVSLHRQYNMQLTCLVKWSALLLYVIFECGSTLLLIDAAILGSTESAVICSLALSAASVASVVYIETMEKQWVHTCTDVITEHVFILSLMYWYGEYPDGFVQHLLLASSWLISSCGEVIEEIDWASWKYQSAVAKLDPLEKRLEAIRAKISSARRDIANHKTLVVIGTGAVGQLVLNRLPSALGQHAHHCVVIDVKEAQQVASALPSEYSYLQFQLESTAESFSLVMDPLGLQPGDFVVELAHGISTSELARWCRVRGLHMVNAQIAEDEDLEEVLDLHEQCGNLEGGVLAEFKDGPTHVYAHGMNPGLVSYGAKLALRDLGFRLGAKCTEITGSKDGSVDNLRRLGEQENMVLNRIANDIKVHRVDITELDTQEYAQNLQNMAAAFVSTWSPEAFHEEVALCEAVCTYGDGVKRLGKYSIDTSQRSITGAPTIKTFEGFIVAHEECFTLRRIFQNTLPVQIQFVYQPSPQMRGSLLGARRVEDLDDYGPATTHVMGKDTKPGGFDSVGALVLAKGGHAQWCGLCLNIEETREHFKSLGSSTSEAQPDSENTLNATSWLTAVGVLMAISVCLEYPNAGALLPEDIPFSVVDQAISKRIIPPFISQSISSEVWTAE